VRQLVSDNPSLFSALRTVAGTLKQATLIKFPKAEAAAELIGKVELDALAMGTGALHDLSRKLPGTRVLEEVIQSTGLVVVVPKRRTATSRPGPSFPREC
jgi:polar amino acid transport system substrate-binding protein